VNTVIPGKVLREVSAAVPQKWRKNIIVVGSLAAAYVLFKDNMNLSVRTKDIDCVLSPRIEAVKSGISIAEKLIAGGWELRTEGRFGKPGDASTLLEDLPAVRLYPPGSKDWFIELLTVPESEQDSGRRWTRLETSSGHFGLPSLRFLSLSTYKPLNTEFGIFCARTEMMVLANLLEHPVIRPDLIEGTSIKRSNKDLGRAVAIATLSTSESIEAWPNMWEEGLRATFPTSWRRFARQTGDGLKTLLGNGSELEQAYETVSNGLLASQNIAIEQYKVAGQRLLQLAVDLIEEAAKGPSS